MLLKAVSPPALAVAPVSRPLLADFQERGTHSLIAPGVLGGLVRLAEFAAAALTAIVIAWLYLPEFALV